MIRVNGLSPLLSDRRWMSAVDIRVNVRRRRRMYDFKVGVAVVRVEGSGLSAAVCLWLLVSRETTSGVGARVYILDLV